MGKNLLEHILALHAAPMIKGIKPATLLSLPKDDNFKKLLNSYKACFLRSGISIYFLLEGEKRLLILFYRKKLLEETLKEKPSIEILKDLGYDENSDISVKLKHLKARLKEKNFPHEIGLFLGYPACDILGFIKHKGHNFLINGYWKVYENEKEMRELFKDYASCTKEFCEMLDKGADFSELLAR